MVKNNEWESAEDEFYQAFNSHKDVYCHRFLDTRDATRVVNQRKDLFGKKVMVKVPKQPADFIVIDNGVTYFADVKTTTSTKGISSSLFRQQRASKLKITNAGGRYFFYVKRLETGQWYMLSSSFDNLNAKWEDLEKAKVDIWG